MTLKEFAKQIKDENAGVARVYIAVMRDDDESPYLLEVETEPLAMIGGCWDTGVQDLERARDQADELDRELTKLGFEVVESRLAWEEMNDDEP
jgi:hypothetical protein